VSGWFISYGFADVLDGLLIGAYPLDEADVSMLHALGVERVLNLVEEAEYRPGDHEKVEAALEAAGIEERRLPLPDYGGLSAPVLERAVREILDWLQEGKRTYLHCRAGWQRAAAVAAGVVAIRDGVDIGEALAIVQSRKSSADPLPHQREDLRRWWDDRAASAQAPPHNDQSGPMRGESDPS
jgi:protein-tyrosine phosphatase